MNDLKPGFKRTTELLRSVHRANYLTGSGIFQLISISKVWLLLRTSVIRCYKVFSCVHAVEYVKEKRKSNKLSQCREVASVNGSNPLKCTTEAFSEGQCN